jgi:hypothetical protein
LFVGDWLRLKGSYRNERCLQEIRGGFGGSGMGGDADRALCRLSSARMLMHSECDRRPEGKQQTYTRDPLRYRAHDFYTMEALFKSIPKQETNATREYLARYVFDTSAKPNASQEFETVVPQMLG